MEMFTASMGEAIDRKLGVDTGLALAKNKLDSELTKMSKFSSDLKPMVSKVAADQHIPDGHREKFIELWTTFSETNSYVENPRGSYISYRDKLRELSDAYQRQSAALNLNL